MAQASIAESYEKQREFFGLSGLALLQLVEDTRKIIAATGKPTPTTIAAYLREHVQWASTRRAPSADTVPC